MVELSRETRETQISVKLELYGQGKSNINTGVGFLDHMLEAFSKHSHINLDVTCNGDTHIDDHHSVEDIGIVIGQALKKELYPIQNIERYGNATVVMDEAAVTCDLDISNRPFLVFDMPMEGKVGNFDVELVEEFFRAITFNASMTVHLICARGTNKHHRIEAAFKALAVALRRGATVNKNAGIPSTKGVL
ncbi:MAG: Imidazoleglycerol-phosphate dehydratase (EC [uncultured Sulfurovum sp.]|uniref:Imidazoleglycerol-phosphate dehydratase n=1 Tax=uncultured Sulfurovum sp. TaxID=269237 RepID=A0A6S6TD68_9BACT|nr:MAG: Imidazoleglycerol-phosphate dehydratase (EC [uncultured Sulfurovum sp.]